ncbi:MAG: NAD-dependent epimerase/dehydratase family protein, partial [Armatimonadetes bacterium]|nr:NAD-dependent epimerase/dehydratase family protein [Armatimonadota bacterium]
MCPRPPLSRLPRRCTRPLASLTPTAAFHQPRERSEVRLLVLGGTVFLGRHLVAEALARGHRVTLFHRGRHGADLFPEAERILGDRDGGLSALADESWDAVVDTSGYVPRVVGAAARMLAPAVGFYVFVSSVSVYADFSPVGMDEDAPLGQMADPSVEEITGETYGPLKALCESEVRSAFGARCAVVRPGLIVGPHDPSDRFTYWPVRCQRGGEVLAPGDPERPVQFIDAGDLAAWIVTMCVRQAGGVFNAVGPTDPTTF